MDALLSEISDLKAENADLAGERDALRKRVDDNHQEMEKLRAEKNQETEKLRAEIAALRARLGEAAKVEAQMEPDAEEEEAKREAAAEDARFECSFYFVSADYLRASTLTTLPSFQELQKTDGAIVRRTLSTGAAYRGEYTAKLLAVSHRWEHPSAPDGTGEQMRQIQAYTREHPEIEGVWYDYWSMPQGDRTRAQRVWFKRMLSNVNLLYLGLRVLALIDISYLSRFWTQFEAWLSMQEGSSDGLRPAPVSRRRVEMRCLHNATAGTEDKKLQSMWEAVTPSEAHALLSKPDVTVTNLSDKETQLVKVKQLDGEMRAAYSAGAAEALKASGVRAEDMNVRFAGATLREAGYTAPEVFGWRMKLLQRGGDTAKEALAAIKQLEPAERAEAAETLGLDPAGCTLEVLEGVVQLEDSHREVRLAAVSTLGKLEAAALAQHAGAIVAKLEDSDWGVRKAAVLTLGMLEAAALAQHADAIVAKLKHSDGGVRGASVSALGKLEAAALLSLSHSEALKTAREKQEGGP